MTMAKSSVASKYMAVAMIHAEQRQQRDHVDGHGVQRQHAVGQTRGEDNAEQAEQQRQPKAP